METMTDLAEIARQAYDALEIRHRGDGTPFATTKDDAPEWVRGLVMAAHGDMFPDDWRYNCIRSAFAYLADGGDPDESGEFADSEVDIYNADRFAWLASNLNRQGYCDEATENFGPSDSITDAIGRGQYVEAEEVFYAVVAGLREVADAQ